MEGFERHLPHDLEPTVDPLAEKLEDEMLRLALEHLNRYWNMEHGETSE